MSCVEIKAQSNKCLGSYKQYVHLPSTHSYPVSFANKNLRWKPCSLTRLLILMHGGAFLFLEGEKKWWFWRNVSLLWIPSKCKGHEERFSTLASFTLELWATDTGRRRRGGGDRWAVKTSLDVPASKSKGDVYQPLSGHINQPWQRSLALFTMFGERRWPGWHGGSGKRRGKRERPSVLKPHFTESKKAKTFHSVEPPSVPYECFDAELKRMHSGFCS